MGVPLGSLAPSHILPLRQALGGGGHAIYQWILSPLKEGDQECGVGGVCPIALFNIYYPVAMLHLPHNKHQKSTSRKWIMVWSHSGCPFWFKFVRPKDEHLITSVPTPAEIYAMLDTYIIGQHKAKKAVAVALRNRWRRRKVGQLFSTHTNLLSPQLKHELQNEVSVSNVFMVGPTGVGRIPCQEYHPGTCPHRKNRICSPTGKTDRCTICQGGCHEVHWGGVQIANFEDAQCGGPTSRKGCWQHNWWPFSSCMWTSGIECLTMRVSILVLVHCKSVDRRVTGDWALLLWEKFPVCVASRITERECFRGQGVRLLW